MTEGLLMEVRFRSFEFRFWKAGWAIQKSRIEKSKIPKSPVHNFGANALVGENLEQQRMREATINEVDALHAFLQRPDRALHFRAHAFVDHPFLLQFIDLADFQRGD